MLRSPSVRAPILLYHWLGDGRGDLHPEFAVGPDQLRRQLVWLKEAGWTAVPLSALGDALAGGAPPPPRSFAVTFDDGYLDFHAAAAPILLSLQVPATVFVVSDLVGGENAWDREAGDRRRPLMGWPELAELAGLGFEIGSHSATHRDLRGLSPAALRAECRTSRDRLEQRLGSPVRSFAFPFGGFDRRVRDEVRAAGYALACAVLLGARDLLRSRRYSLMRTIVHGNRSFASFRRRARLLAPSHRPDRRSAA